MPETHFWLGLALGYVLPAVVLWTVLLVDAYYGLVGEEGFVDRAVTATWPLINLGALILLCFRYVYHAVRRG